MVMDKVLARTLLMLMRELHADDVALIALALLCQAFSNYLLIVP